MKAPWTARGDEPYRDGWRTETFASFGGDPASRCRGITGRSNRGWLSCARLGMTSSGCASPHTRKLASRCRCWSRQPPLPEQETGSFAVRAGRYCAHDKLSRSRYPDQGRRESSRHPPLSRLRPSCPHRSRVRLRPVPPLPAILRGGRGPSHPFHLRSLSRTGIAAAAGPGFRSCRSVRALR